MKKNYFLIALFAGLIFSASSQALISEDFDYGASAGDLVTVAGGTWVNHSGTNLMAYQTSNLTMTSYPNSGVGGSALVDGGQSEDVHRAFTAATTGTIYASALINVASASTTENYFMHFQTGSTSFYGRVYGKDDGSGNLKLGISESSNGTITYSSANYAYNTTYILVIKYDFSSGTASLFVLSAVTGTEPSADATDNTGTNPTTIDKIGLRESSNIPLTTVDGLRVATSWSDLMSAPSSPTISFASATQTESETAGTVSVSMSISPAPAGAETIDVTIADVSATYTDDYTTTSAGTFTVNVSASATSATFDVVLVDDALMESAETFTATISNPSGGLTLGTTTVLTFTINDDDTPVTTMAIKDVQATTDGESSDELGNTVTIGGIVYGIASNGFYIQDNPGAWNGIFVYDNGTNVVSRGDSVLLTGIVDEFGSVISSAELTTQIKDLTSFEIEMGSPYAMHAAAELSTSAVNDEMYEGVLVKVSQAVVTGEENAFGEWTCSDGSGDTSIDDLLYKDLTPPSIGQIYTVTGAVNHSFGTYKIEPRDADDIILESGVGVDENNVNNVEIYPNPSTGLINVINTNNVNVEVYNTLGELVKLTSKNQINLTSGFYIVKVGQHTESIIVE